RAALVPAPLRGGVAIDCFSFGFGYTSAFASAGQLQDSFPNPYSRNTWYRILGQSTLVPKTERAEPTPTSPRWAPFDRARPARPLHLVDRTPSRETLKRTGRSAWVGSSRHR